MLTRDSAKKKKTFTAFWFGTSTARKQGPLIDNTTMFHVMQRMSTVVVILPTILWTDRKTWSANKIHFCRKGVSPLLEQNKTFCPSTKHSLVWKCFYFGENSWSPKNVVCKVLTLTAAPQGDNRNFYNHLKRHHRATFWQRDSLNMLTDWWSYQRRLVNAKKL